MPFTLRNLKADLEDVGSNFDGAPDLEFRLATQALELEKSGLSYQRVPPTNRWRAGVGRQSIGTSCALLLFARNATATWGLEGWSQAVREADDSATEIAVATSEKSWAWTTFPSGRKA